MLRWDCDGCVHWEVNWLLPWITPKVRLCFLKCGFCQDKTLPISCLKGSTFSYSGESGDLKFSILIYSTPPFRGSSPTLSCSSSLLVQNCCFALSRELNLQSSARARKTVSVLLEGTSNQSSCLRLPFTLCPVPKLPEAFTSYIKLLLGSSLPLAWHSAFSGC